MTGLNLKKIRERRKELRLTQEYVAKYLGYETATGYSYIESGRSKLDPDKLPLLAEVLEYVTVDELFFARKNTKLVQNETA